MRCQRLNCNGKRCKAKAIYKEEYFGDHIMYYDLNKSKEIGWALIFVCGKHLHTLKDSDNFAGKITKEDLL